MADLHDLTLADAASAIARRDLSPVDLVRALFAHIDGVEPKVRAWARLRREESLAEAARLERLAAGGKLLGPLHGVPLGVKDIYFTAGWETSAGSRILAGFVPAYDSTVVARLRAAGAIIIGKAHTTEFAMMDPAPTRNPWNLAHTPGGSSSGSAAAVAARMVPGAFGSQTAGSILRPAAFCGIVGLKPTYGRVSRHGVVPLAWSLDHPGPMARTVRDVALLLGTVAGSDPQDAATVPEPVPDYGVAAAAGSAGDGRGLRVGVPDRFFAERADAEAAAMYRRGLEVLRGAGCRVDEVRLPVEMDAVIETHRTIMAAEVAAFHQAWHRERAQDLGPKLRAMIESGLLVPAASYLRAQQIRTALTAGMRRLFAQIDVLAMPSAPGPAPEGLASTGDPVMNAPFSLIGFPSISVPAGLSAKGLPLGLQLGAPPFDESTLLRAAAVFEAAAGWGDRRPPL